VEQIEHRAAPAGQFRNKDCVDIAGLRQCKDLLTFGALILCPRGSFLPNPCNFITGFFGESAKIAFLASAGLIGRRYPAIKALQTCPI
jgi:hypothetical protein